MRNDHKRKKDILQRLLNLFLAKRKFIYLIILIISVSVIYLKTLLPGLGFSGDTAKFQFIGKVLGVPHAPGYPLYVILNHFFTLIPIKSVAFRANLMSAVFSVLTLLVLYFFISLLVKKVEISFFCTLSFAFTYSFWSHSVVAEVYSLNALFLALVLFLLTKLYVHKKEIYFYLFLFAYALSFGNHLTMITIFPAILAFVILVNHKIVFKPRSIILACVALVIGVGQYLFLYVRTLQNAAYLEQRVYVFKDFINVITGKQFREKMFAFPPQEVIFERIPMFFKLLQKEITVIGIILAIVGLFFLLKKDKKIFILLFFSAIGEIFYFINYNIGDISGYIIPISLIAIISVAYGIFGLLGSIKIRFFHVFFYALPFTIAIYLCSSGFPQFNWKKDVALDKKLTALFEYLPPQSIIVTDEYLDMQFVYCKMFVEYSSKEILQFFINSKKDISSQLLTRLVLAIKNNKNIQKRFGLEDALKDIKDMRPHLARLRIQYILFNDRSLQEKLISNMYLLSPNLNMSFKAQNIKTVPFLVSSKKNRKKYVFYKIIFIRQD